MGVITSHWGQLVYVHLRVTWDKKIGIAQWLRNVSGGRCKAKEQGLRGLYGLLFRRNQGGKDWKMGVE